jgi:UDP-N-acetylglucosamine--N-acetylmuramyl-(pentapeptide) pyrophosphoryl-undecaprenol N-acetylglucosamine transferase
MQKSLKKILIAAGGTGGHLFPAQTLGSELQGRATVMIAGHDLCKNPFFNGEISARNIMACNPKKGSYFRFFWMTIVGFFQAIVLLLQFRPHVVVGFGSYHTFPLLLASVCLRKKIVLFEANCVLGKVNRFFAPFSNKIGVQFPLISKAFDKKTMFVSLESSKSQKRPSKDEAYAYFGLDSHILTLLVFGGSQGASFFNEIMPKVLPFFPNLQVIHCAGKGSTSYRDGKVCVKGFEKRMDLAYTVADIVVCRSGAGTIAELISYQKPSLLVPFPFATEDHQLKNGRFLVDEVKGARLLEQKNGTVEKMVEEIGILLRDRKIYEQNLERWECGKRKRLSEVCYEI